MGDCLITCAISRGKSRVIEGGWLVTGNGEWLIADSGAWGCRTQLAKGSTGPQIPSLALILHSEQDPEWVPPSGSRPASGVAVPVGWSVRTGAITSSPQSQWDMQTELAVARGPHGGAKLWSWMLPADPLATSSLLSGD